MQTAEFNLPNMTCESCAEKIETAIKQAGANSVEFDFKTRNATVVFDDVKTNYDTLKSAIKTLGYEVL